MSNFEYFKNRSRILDTREPTLEFYFGRTIVNLGAQNTPSRSIHYKLQIESKIHELEIRKPIKKMSKDGFLM